MVGSFSDKFLDIYFRLPDNKVKYGFSLSSPICFVSTCFPFTKHLTNIFSQFGYLYSMVAHNPQLDTISCFFAQENLICFDFLIYLPQYQLINQVNVEGTYQSISITKKHTLSHTFNQLILCLKGVTNLTLNLIKEAIKLFCCLLMISCQLFWY